MEALLKYLLKKWGIKSIIYVILITLIIWGLAHFKEPARGITFTPIPPLVPYPEEIKITDVCYTIDGGSIISKEFREQFIKSFDESLGRMYHLCQ